MVGSCVGCHAAVLVDHEGEAVDYAGNLPPYEAKLAGAHWQIVLREVFEASRVQSSGAGEPHSIVVRTATRGFLLRRVFGDYVVIVVCEPNVLSTLSDRALSQVEHELRREAGWPELDGASAYWERVMVSCDERGHPERVHRPREPAEPLEVVGPLDVVGDFERGFHARTERGRRLVLVREPSGFWYERDDAT
jgi:hypothetical protein